MWNYGKVDFGDLGNLYISLVDSGGDVKKCIFDLVIYLIIIKELCKVGRFEDVRKMLIEMIGKNIYFDVIIYNIFIYSYFRIGKILFVFRVFKDMEKKGFDKIL